MKTRVLARTYDETLYADLDVSLIRILLSWRNIGSPSVVEDSKKVKVNAKKPNRNLWPSIRISWNLELGSVVGGGLCRQGVSDINGEFKDVDTARDVMADMLKLLFKEI
ncbi:hypothetical protein V2J09_018955 [Rumex salicifolius]